MPARMNSRANLDRREPSSTRCAGVSRRVRSVSTALAAGDVSRDMPTRNVPHRNELAGAGTESRTRTPLAGQGILSPLRLPVPPSRRGGDLTAMPPERVPDLPRKTTVDAGPVFAQPLDEA